MKIKTYINIIIGCLIGEILVAIILSLVALATLISFIWYAIKSTIYLIFHPIKFFKEKKETPEPFSSILCKKFMEGVQNGLKGEKQTQNNGDFSKNNIQIGSINNKETLQ